MALLVKSTDPPTAIAPANAEASETNTSPLQTAIATLEKLKLAELQNFFGDDCVQVALSNAKESTALQETNTAVVYFTILPESLETILQLPSGDLVGYRQPIATRQLEDALREFRFQLQDGSGGRSYLALANQLYDWLIRPIEPALQSAQPDTLVFVNDGALRLVPMAALHDGQQFLIEKYAIATTPSLSLTTLKPSENRDLRALVLGLSVDTPDQDFGPLENVATEAKTVQELLDGTLLLDDAFTLENLQASLQERSYPVIHMATHGQFGIDANNTFLLSFDRRISIEQLDNLLRAQRGRRPVELLTLSACETALGDDRSALGIGGVAVRAGVESAVATVWKISDEATVPLIEEFYRQLSQPGVSKAQALRAAQLQTIAAGNYDHPFYWSPFILIGNWL